MARVFRRNVSTQIKKWQYNALPERRIELINNQFSSKSFEDYEYVAKVGALECISKMSSQYAYKAKTKAFRMITQHMFNKRSENDHDENLNEKLELLNRLNVMME